MEKIAKKNQARGQNHENRLSPSPGGPWDSWDVGARISRKAARWSMQHLGQLGRQDAWGVKSRTGRRNEENCLSLVSQSEGHPGQKYVKGTDRPVWCKAVHFGRAGEICPRQSRTVGPRVRGGREPAGSAETEDFHLGHPGQKYARDAKTRKSHQRIRTGH
ncbi:hypothetical protein KI387_027091, partial [Taxus chinensis]